MSIKVFLSVGRTSTPEQEAFVKAVEVFMLAEGLLPRTVGRNYFSSQQPLKSIREVMGQCAGTVIVAYERLHITQGLERRGSPKATELAGLSLPTVWNQIEAAMAYTLGQPLLAIAESGLRDEGLLEEGYDWFVKWVALNPASLNDPEFRQTFENWKQNVEAYHAQIAGRLD
jgi:hypothetical protein